MTIPMQWALRRRMMMPVLDIDVAALSINYTGRHTDYGMVTMSDGARYRLLAFTSSGTLSIEQPVNCEVCVVGGGAHGAKAESEYGGASGAGGAGAYLKNQSVSAYNGGRVVVGASSGRSSIANVSVEGGYRRDGGTGGSAGNGFPPGKGDGLSKYPFEDTGHSLWAGKPHCAGGGQGANEFVAGAGDTRGNTGGAGGTNGGNGYPEEIGWVSPAYGGAGGSYGGGAGGDRTTENGRGRNATYYGSAGGGGRYFRELDGTTLLGDGGRGYQGIVYIRIPVIQ